MTKRSDNLIAARVVCDDGVAQVAMWQETDGSAVVLVRQQPDADAPRARWYPGKIPAPLWPTKSASAKQGAIGLVQGYLSNRLPATDGPFRIEGVYSLTFSEKDHDELDAGTKEPNSLKTRLARAFDDPAPRTVQKDTLHAVAEWLVTEPLIALVDGDLSAYTEAVLSGPTATFTLKEGEDEGILLSDGKTRFIARIMKNGLTDVTFLRQARANGLTVLLIGPPGTGKSAAVEAAFHEEYLAAGLDFNEDALVVGTEDTTTTDLIGGMVQGDDGIFRFKPGKIIKCAQAGVPAFIDEALLIDPRVLSVIYSLVDGRGVLPLPEEYRYTDPVSGLENAVKAQPGFYLVFAGNPNVPGAVISEALKSRCKLRPEYLTDWDTVARLLGPAHDEIITVCRNMETKRQEGEVVESPQMREMLAYRDIAATFGTEMALSNLVSFFDSDSDREVFLDVVARTMGVSNIPIFRV